MKRKTLPIIIIIFLFFCFFVFLKGLNNKNNYIPNENTGRKILSFTAKKLFNNGEFRKKSIEKYQNFILSYVTNVGNACNKTWSFITKT